jgi:glycosyltransferase involved in cell wall biosynthesis
MLNIFGRTKYKDYEETENIKNPNEENEQSQNNIMERISIFTDKKKIIFFVCGLLVIIFLLLLSFFKIYKKEVVTPVTRQTPLFQKNQQPQMNQTLQQNPIIKQQNPIIKQQNPLIKQQNPIIPNQQKPLNQQQNQSMQIVQKKLEVYQIKKPLDRNVTKYLPFFPKILTELNVVQNTTNNTVNISQYFTSKRLYISGKNITYDYIHFIRQNDTDEEKNKKVLFPSENFSQNPFSQRPGQLSTKDFYNICNQKNLELIKDINSTNEPLISVIIPVFLTTANIIKTLRSVQNQSLKNIEIIIVDDVLTRYKNLYNQFFESDPRIRVFTQLRKNSVWRKRLDGFLYSRGKYILHINPSDILADNFVLEDAYNLLSKYSLDTVRFSFSKTLFNLNFEATLEFGNMKIYPLKHLKIIYGRPDYDVHEFGYGTVWNRVIRANMFTKGLDLVDEYIINAKKNLWEDMWWNDLIDRVSFSNLVVNRLGYIFLYNRATVIEPSIKLNFQRDKTIREFIYFWYFDYILLPKEDNKKSIMKTLINYNKADNTFCRLPMKIQYLIFHFKIYERLLQLLIDDPSVSEEDKKIVKELNKTYNELMKSNEGIRKKLKELEKKKNNDKTGSKKNKKNGKDGKKYKD